MLKIKRANRTPKGWTLQLEGRIVGPWVEALREYCELALRDGCALTLDLSAVAFADLTGAQLLQDLSDRCVTLSAPTARIPGLGGAPP